MVYDDDSAYGNPVRLWLTNVDAANNRILVSEEGFSSWGPVWSAGELIAFNHAENSGYPPNYSGIWAIDPATGETQEVFQDGMSVSIVGWSADEQQLLLEGTSERNDIQIVPLDGSSPIVLYGECPRWQPVNAQPTDPSTSPGDCGDTPDPAPSLNHTRVEVLYGTVVELRAQPTLQSETLASLRSEDTVDIIGEAQCSDGYRWWPARLANGQTGWIRDGDEEGLWLEIISVTCSDLQGQSHLANRLQGTWYMLRPNGQATDLGLTFGLPGDFTPFGELTVTYAGCYGFLDESTLVTRHYDVPMSARGFHTIDNGSALRQDFHTIREEQYQLSLDDGQLHLIGDGFHAGDYVSNRSCSGASNCSVTCTDGAHYEDACPAGGAFASCAGWSEEACRSHGGIASSAQTTTGLGGQSIALPTNAAQDLTTSPCPGAPAARLQVGGQARQIIDQEPLALRVQDEPSGVTTLFFLYPDNIVDVIDGPQCSLVQGQPTVWWKIRGVNNWVGWVAEGRTGNYYLEPYPR